MQITKESLRRKNFEPSDFFKSETARNLKINNSTDSISVLTCLMLVADKMQQIRDLIRKPIIIGSAYRCLKLNRALRSKDNSQHIQGQAVDFVAPAFGTPTQIVQFLMENKIEVDQCLLEASWVHLSIKHNQNRNQFGKLIDGKFTILSF